MKTIAIVDYGMGNLASVARAIEACGATPRLIDRPEDLAQASAIVLPGVGAFADGMRELRERGLADALRREVLENGIPLLGICLGMQLLADTGHEGGETAGLGLIAGAVVRLEARNGERIPHVGWDEAHFRKPDCPLFAGIESGKDFYFVHSYHVRCADTRDVAADTPYCGGFTSVVWRKNVFGAQFHPEKSQKPGLRFLRNFAAL